MFTIFRYIIFLYVAQTHNFHQYLRQFVYRSTQRVIIYNRKFIILRHFTFPLQLFFKGAEENINFCSPFIVQKYRKSINRLIGQLTEFSASCRINTSKWSTWLICWKAIVRLMFPSSFESQMLVFLCKISP